MKYKTKPNIKRFAWVTAMTAACIAMEGNFRIQQQSFNPQQLSLGASQYEINKYEDSLTLKTKWNDLFTSRYDKENRAKRIIAQYRKDEETDAKKKMAAIFDENTKQVVPTATMSDVQAAKDALNKLPADDRRVYASRLQRANTEVAENSKAVKAVAAVWDDQAQQLVGTRTQYKSARMIVDELDDDSVVKDSLDSQLIKANAFLDLKEQIEAVKPLVSKVYKSGQLVGTRRDYNKAYKAAKALPDSIGRRQYMQDLQKADLLLKSKEQSAETQKTISKKASTEAETAKQIEEEQQALQRSQPTGNTSDTSQPAHGNTQQSTIQQEVFQ